MEKEKDTIKKTDNDAGAKTDGRRGGSGGTRGNGPRRSFARPKPEFDQKILTIRRVTRVVAGGRRFSFSVAMAIGDKKGSVGFGIGKAGDTALAINKAIKSAKKNMIKIKMTKTGSIPFGVAAKYSSSKVMISPNNGRGLSAGSAVRDILRLAGVKDVSGKVNSGSKNKLNIAKATLSALSEIAVPKTEAYKSPETLEEESSATPAVPAKE